MLISNVSLNEKIMFFNSVTSFNIFVLRSASPNFLLSQINKCVSNSKQEPNDVVFLDRGIPDVLAYMHYIGDSYPAFFDTTCKENKYTKIFILPPWEDIYVADNERYENYEQAKLIYNHLVETYQKYDYNLIEVPKDTVDNRILFILGQII